jgi:hypothetical protein
LLEGGAVNGSGDPVSASDDVGARSGRDIEKGDFGMPVTGQKKGDFGSELGTSAKYSSLVDFKGDFIDSETGEVCHEKPVYDPVSTRLERFALQSASRRILRYSTVSRVARCLRVRRPDKAVIEVFRSVDHKAAFFAGLQTCSSVWVCPPCASKISERRRIEICWAIEQHKANGGDVILLTLTTPHYLGDRLEDVLEGQKQALVYFNGGGAAKQLNESIGCIGQIRALEVTHGRLRVINNGWHPHYHILLFVRSGLDLEALRCAYFDRWSSACLKAGLKEPTFEYGVTLKDGTFAASYASKWGLESEMTKGHTKKSPKEKGETPFDFLRAFLMDDDKQAAGLFSEFARAFKGKRQLHWSSGLKELFDIQEMSDPEIAGTQDDKAVLLGRIELEDWRLILKYDVRGEILELARFGWEPVERLLCDLRKKEAAT